MSRREGGEHCPRFCEYLARESEGGKVGGGARTLESRRAPGSSGLRTRVFFMCDMFFSVFSSSFLRRVINIFFFFKEGQIMSIDWGRCSII